MTRRRAAMLAALWGLGLLLFQTLFQTRPATAYTIGFDALSPGEVVTGQLPGAVFSTEPGFEILVHQTLPELAASPPNFICTAPAGQSVLCDSDVRVDFRQPVRELSFFALGVNGTGPVASIDVETQGAPPVTLDLVGFGDRLTPVAIDLSSFENVTALRIHSITDDSGIGFDSFTFFVVPEPSTLALLAVGLVGLALRRR